MKKRLVILFLIASVAVSNVLAATLQNDSIYLISTSDTVKVVETEEYVSKSTFQPDAQKSVWLAAVVPGLGQIYNRQYWKVPIIYGGALGLAYGITWNDRMFVDYKKG